MGQDLENGIKNYNIGDTRSQFPRVKKSKKEERKENVGSKNHLERQTMALMDNERERDRVPNVKSEGAYEHIG